MARQVLQPQQILVDPQQISVDDFNNQSFTWEHINDPLKTKVVNLMKLIMPISCYIKRKIGDKTITNGAILGGVHGAYRNHPEYKDPERRYWRIDTSTYNKFITDESEAQESEIVFDCLETGEEFIIKQGTLMERSEEHSFKCITYITDDWKLVHTLNEHLNKYVDNRNKYTKYLCRNKKNLSFRNLPRFMLLNPDGGKKCICWWDKNHGIYKPGEFIITIRRRVSYDICPEHHSV